MFKKKKRRKPFSAYSPTLGYRQVTIQCKQARTVHAYERELSELLALALKIWRYSSWREQETKAQIQYFISTNGNAFRC
jgi:hypothetical protein